MELELELQLQLQFNVVGIILMIFFKSVEKVEKRCEPGVTSGLFGLLVTPGWREGNSNM